MNQTTQTLGIRNPSLSLCAFHLRNSIAPNHASGVEADADRLWQKLQAIGQQLQVPELADLPSKLICYQNGQYTPAAEGAIGDDRIDLWRPDCDRDSVGVSQIGGLQLQTVISAYRIDDTYAVDLNFFYDATIAVSQLNHFNPSGCLLPNQIQASFGQTLLLLAEPVETQSDYKTLADACVAALVKDSPLPQLIDRGYLFGSPIFEYDTGELDPSQQCHILIWLDSPETRNLVAKNSFLLLNLLCCHHKILYNYHTSRSLKQRAIQLYNQLETPVNTLTQLTDKPAQILEPLKALLSQLPQTAFKYARYCRDLEDYATTIDINATNYQDLLSNKLPPLETDDRGFLEKFLTRTKSKFIPQIQADLKYLEPGQELFSQMISTIRGIVDIEQAERDRALAEQLRSNEAAEKQRAADLQDILKNNELAERKSDRALQNTIQAVGAGLGLGIGFAQILAGSYTLLKPEDPLLLPWDKSAKSIHPFVASLTLSLVVGFIIGWVTWRITKFFLNKTAQKQLSSSQQSNINSGNKLP